MDQVEKESFNAFEFDGEAAYEMANVSKSDTGIPYDLWIDSLGSDRGGKHGPRVKVDVNGKWIPVTISEDPDLPKSVRKTGVKDFPHLAEVKEYIRAYCQVLLAHYHKKLTDKQVLMLLSTIEEAKKLKEDDWITIGRLDK